MITLLSPSKGQDFDNPAPVATHTTPLLLDHSKQLVEVLRAYDSAGLQDLMGISKKLADLNVGRFKDFSVPFDEHNSKQALCAFTGDVYSSIQVSQFTKSDFSYAQEHLRILSGLYGCLRPLDLIQPYRLEMKTKLTNKRGANLYGFWGQLITEMIIVSLAGHTHKAVINLASNEYFKVVDSKKLRDLLVTVVFKEIKDSKAKVVAIYAKRARGMMADYIIRQRIDSPAGLKNFNSGGYRYDEELSDPQQYIFVRPQPS